VRERARPCADVAECICVELKTHSHTISKHFERSQKTNKRNTPRTDYPRIDPAIITLVTAGEWALLGRKPGWAAGRFSTLAGFLEVGETLEQALAREVFEESAVHVDERSIRYVGSQPWPFPRSLMVGFRAECRVADGGGSDGGDGASSGYDLLKGPARAAALGVGIRCVMRV
jgi:ADP-ribose pyrophosphatase YjhB (NUDIX family)